jgi:hypothetical protein
MHAYPLVMGRVCMCVNYVVCMQNTCVLNQKLQIALTCFAKTQRFCKKRCKNVNTMQNRNVCTYVHICVPGAGLPLRMYVHTYMHTHFCNTCTCAQNTIKHDRNMIVTVNHVITPRSQKRGVVGCVRGYACITCVYQDLLGYHPKTGPQNTKNVKKRPKKGGLDADPCL